MNSALRESVLSNAVICEAVRLIEETGPLDDAAAVREILAQSPPTDMRTLVTRRALALGQRIGLQNELVRARHWALWIGVGLVIVIVMTGLGLAGNVTGGNERHINIMTALVSLLGIHAITLLLWLAGLVVPLRSFNVSLGWLWLALTARVAGGKQGQAPVLLRATTQLLARARLLPWAFGLVSHCIWALSFVVVLVALLFALAFRSYTLSWETTILDPDFFVRGVRVLGWLPGWLGFPVPDAAMVLTAPYPPSGSVGGMGGAGQRTWALWFTGCIVVYGLLPRLLFALISAGMWHRRRSALQPDFNLPYYRKLMARFDALAPATIVDADSGEIRQHAPDGLLEANATDTLTAVGFELPPETPWPPDALVAANAQILRIDGSAQQRRHLLDTVARMRPRALLIACHAASSPDRGTERLLRELLAHCGECRLWLIGATPPDATAAASDELAARQRWRRWLGDTGLQRITASDDLATALKGWQ